MPMTRTASETSWRGSFGIVRWSYGADALPGWARSPDEAGHHLGVMRLGEQVDELGPLEAEALGSQELGVAAEGGRITADQHEHRGLGGGEGGDGSPAQPRSGRVGHHQVSR